MLYFIVRLYLPLKHFWSALIYIFCLCFKYFKINYAISIFFFCMFVSTEPLLNEDMSVGCMPHKQHKDLTFCLSGRESGWRLHTHLVVTFDWKKGCRLSTLKRTLEKSRALTRFDFADAFSEYIPARLVHRELNFVRFRQNPFQKDNMKPVIQTKFGGYRAPR